MKQPQLERFWSVLLDDDGVALAGLTAPLAAFDDPILDAPPVGDVAAHVARLSAWLRERATGASPRHLATTSDARRVVVEHVLELKDGLVFNQAERRSERAARFELAAAVVADRASPGADAYSEIRVYFGTWSVLNGQSRLRVGPIAPDERDAARVAIDAIPVLRTYFDALAAGDAKIQATFEPDGHFREPANNYACGGVQLREHFTTILELGGVGIDFLTATREGQRLALELQTVTWGPKKMPEPQAGFAAYELGPHGLIQKSRVYDSVVPPAFE